jgi:hypothetical protein
MFEQMKGAAAKKVAPVSPGTGGGLKKGGFAKGASNGPVSPKKGGALPKVAAVAPKKAGGGGGGPPAGAMKKGMSAAPKVSI